MLEDLGPFDSINDGGDLGDLTGDHFLKLFTTMKELNLRLHFSYASTQSVRRATAGDGAAIWAGDQRASVGSRGWTKPTGSIRVQRVGEGRHGARASAGLFRPRPCRVIARRANWGED